METLHEVITFLVSMQISITSLKTHNVNSCGRRRNLARKLSLRRTQKPGEQLNMHNMTHNGKRINITSSVLSTMDPSDRCWVRMPRVGQVGLSLEKKFEVDLTKIPTGPARGHDMLLR